MVGGKVVYAAGPFGDEDDSDVPPAMPNWSPARAFGGYGAWGDDGRPLQAAANRRAAVCGCDRSCTVHGHAHATSWASKVPVSDLKSFWGALGCACWAA